jgi:fatty-acyl-CoA synthase
MQGLMQNHPLLISSILTHAARHHGTAEIVTRADDGTLRRTTYAAAERRARRLARVLQGLGVRQGERLATLAMNSDRHFELYYAISGSGAVCNTVNPRLAADDIAYIITHAEDTILFADPGFAPLVEQLAPHISSCVHTVVVLGTEAEMPDLHLVPGMKLLCYETLMAEADEDYAWPQFAETTASSLCYTSGTTGRPKGVLYSHRAMVLHAMLQNFADTTSLRAIDRVLMLVPMFHANAWCMPYAAPMAGAGLVLPGRHLDPATIIALANGERCTISFGVPTLWLNLLAHLDQTGERIETLNRILCGGVAVPKAMMARYEAMGIPIIHAWGMTETGPLATLNAATPATAAMQGEAGLDQRLRQGRVVFGMDVRAIRDDCREAPWDGRTPGALTVRGHWCASGYYRQPETDVGATGWFPTGDVGMFDEHGYVLLTDRTKDLIKSGGEWISSIELENLAMGHPDIQQAAAIAAQHPQWSERPVVIVTPRAGHTVDPEAVRDWYRGRVPSWWVPDRVMVVDELPHGATGKVQKAVLRERYRDALVTAGSI